MTKEYKLTQIADLLTVPIERREDCARALLYALAMQDLAFGDESASVGFGEVVWRDDGDHSVDLRDSGGAVVLSLKVSLHCDGKPFKDGI